MALVAVVHSTVRRQASTPGSGQPDIMTADLPSACVRLLKLQHGAIARWQAVGVGLDLATVDAMLRRGRWQTLYRGVYAAFTGDPPRACLLWAGLLRAGPGAALSHHSAAELDGLTDHGSKIIHVTVSHERRVKVSHEEPLRRTWPVAIHRTSRIDAMTHPARTPPRTRVEETILDLAQLSATFDEVFSWLCKGCGRRLVTPQRIHTAAGLRSRLRWRDEILGALPLLGEGVNSYLEYRYVHDVERAHRLPAATRQPKVVLTSQIRQVIYLDNRYDPVRRGRGTRRPRRPSGRRSLA